MIHSRRVFPGAGIAALLIAGSGCLSAQNQASLDGTQPASPVVEAYVEYPGPQQKWSGPATFILHVQARDAGAATIAMTPEPLRDAVPAPSSEDEPEVASRVPASSALSAGPARRLTSEEARGMLAHLSAALEGGAAPFKGCMSPVRVRLVRADGGLVEKQGCRSEQGWSRAVSESVNAFITASVSGVGAEAVRTQSAAPVRAAEKAESISAWQ